MHATAPMALILVEVKATTALGLPLPPRSAHVPSVAVRHWTGLGDLGPMGSPQHVQAAAVQGGPRAIWIAVVPKTAHPVSRVVTTSRFPLNHAVGKWTRRLDAAIQDR